MSNPSATSNSAAKPGNTRTLVLVGVLVVGVALLGYDFYVARPACDAGYAKVQALLESRMGKGHGKDVIGPADVQKAVGFAPASQEKKDDYLIETYQWRGGAMIRSYKVYAVYRGGQNPKLHNVLQNEYPPDEILPSAVSRPAPAGKPSTDNAAAAQAPAAQAPPTEPGEPAPAPESKTNAAKDEPKSEPKKAE